MTSAESERGRPALDRRARLLLPLLFLALVGLSFYHYSRAPEREVYSLSGSAMGTGWALKIAGPMPALEHSAALETLVTTRLARIDEQMSTWKPDSLVSRFNAAASGEIFALPKETRDVLRISREVSELSGGAFDVTVGPLVRLWGFGAGASVVATPPSVEAERQAQAQVGFRKLRIDASGNLEKTVPGLHLDLSAVAKGYAVDFVALGLQEQGYDAFLFELGGELRARGSRKGGAPWRVAIEAPRTEGRAVHRIVELRDAAMATSGDYRSFYERDGERFSHTIDPRTGRPVAHGLASITVIHPEAARADALATALSVLGVAEGLALARAEGLAAYFIQRVGEGFEISMTEPFRAFLASEPGGSTALCARSDPHRT